VGNSKTKIKKNARTQARSVGNQPFTETESDPSLYRQGGSKEKKYLALEYETRGEGEGVPRRRKGEQNARKTFAGNNLHQKKGGGGPT